jgi:hypothetical protein
MAGKCHVIRKWTQAHRPSFTCNRGSCSSPFQHTACMASSPMPPSQGPHTSSTAEHQRLEEDRTRTHNWKRYAYWLICFCPCDLLFAFLTNSAAGVLIWPSANGAPCARITLPMVLTKSGVRFDLADICTKALAGPTSLTIMRDRGHTGN